MRLLYRFYDPTSGKILIENQNIREVDLSSLRMSMGVVPQEPILFHQNILYNLQYGRLDASEEEVIEKAKMAEIHDSIMNFNLKYMSPVGERGLELSGLLSSYVGCSREREYVNE